MDTCKIRGCKLRHHARGLCRKHYCSRKSTGQFGYRQCITPHCTRHAHAQRYCKSCYGRHINHQGTPLNVLEVLAARQDWRCGDFARDKAIKGCGYNLIELLNEKDLIQIDHIKPLSLGGTTSMGNLQLLCTSCNKGAGNDYEEIF